MFVLLSMKVHAQDLTQHQWENRLIILLCSDPGDVDVKKQLNEFRHFAAGLQERKVLVYQVTPERFKQGWDNPDKWKKSDHLFSKYKSDGSDFGLLLIGLDGGIKLREKEPISCEKIFRLIDSMPMRKREIEQNQDN